MKNASRWCAPTGAHEVTWRHWVLLAASMWAAAATSTIVMGAAYLLPALHLGRGLSLGRAAFIVALPQAGILVALIAWGWVVDRVGERRVLVVGTALTAVALGGAALTDSFWSLGVFLWLAGAAAASTNSASGRVVVGWFPAHRRGVAMGARQMAVPLGAAIAALTMPALAARSLGAALVVPLVACASAAVTTLVLVADPPRLPRSHAQAAALLENPYRASAYLARLHAVSVLLVVPQALMGAFLLIWLMTAHGWSAAAAGVAVTVSQVLGAVGRLLAGAWSDRVGSRLGPLRRVAAVAAGAGLVMAVAEGFDWPSSVTVVVAVALTVVSVADNGLAFTAVAERAGPYWSGRALGMQNTVQFLAMTAVTPAFGLLVEKAGYAAAFAVSAAVAAAAVPLVPRGEVSARG